MRFFRYSPAVTIGFKKFTNLFQIGLFPHKKKSNLPISARKSFVMWKRRTSNVQLMLTAIFLFRWLRYQLNTLIVKAKWRSLWRHMWRHHILTNLNNAKIISQIPSSSNLLFQKHRVFLRGNQRFVHKSKMATKEGFKVANSKFDLQSESYRSILAIMYFCDAFFSKF